MSDDDKDFQNQLLGAIEDLTDALNKEAKPPRITVDVPPGTPPRIEVKVPPAAAPEVRVSAPVTVNNPARGFSVEVTERDDYNLIRKLTITPSK